jgi:hypothetical protein
MEMNAVTKKEVADITKLVLPRPKTPHPPIDPKDMKVVNPKDVIKQADIVKQAAK